MSILLPSALPKKALPSGDSLEIFPSKGLASCAPTIVYSFFAHLLLQQ